MMLNYWLAICGILIVSVLNRYYDIKSGSVIVFLGSIYYFYHLCHVRISYQLMIYMEINDLLFWTCFTIYIAWFLKFTYDLISFKLSL